MDKDLLTQFFKEDSELLNKYHISAPNTAENCAERTLNDLKEANVETYLFTIDNEIIGYYGIESKVFLTGFFIKPAHRNKRIITEFWNQVSSNFKGDFYAALYIKNTRAMDFLRKQSITETVVDDAVLFRIKRS